MRIPLRLLPTTRARGALAVRTATCRRICGASYNVSTEPSSLADLYSLSLSFRPHTLKSLSLGAIPSTSRAFASSAFRFQDQRQSEEIRDPPRSNDPVGKKRARPSYFEGASTAPPEDPLNENYEDPSSKKSSESEGKEQSSEKGEKDDNKKKKEEAPPPPPHGDKSPWQVFTDTLKSEFQASKEWNESTKALASSAHQFTENESVKRARAAYSAASGAATSTTSSAFRGTGKVLGQGAAWTWDTPVVKGVRSGVKATGRGIEKVTRPVRETKVYKTTVGGVKDVIDDGSSSRYGGWVEKEERRKQRELRELNETTSSGRPGRKGEKIVEDPK